ncbi:unnamed protein product [Allacma fusca]|uniref:CS domain-containing protein n=1 Tax=Allacma fusca TaxID=39272 RepID=A0A8J2KNK3_9HEXA|nr:unnamed protein product [Allacma fusca]
MSRITIELLRKRVEHNEGEIQTVEELALHQEKIEKLENLDKWCRKLKILLLQNNLISKIENHNHNLENLYLTDGADVTMTEKLVARQEFESVRRDILFAEAEYKAQREIQKQSYIEDLGSSDDETCNNDEYWNKLTPNTPEVRKEMTLRSMKLEEKSKEAKGSMNPQKKKPKELSLFYSDGRPKNINQAKVAFSLQDQQENILTLDVSLPKYMDSSLIVADVQPTYAKIVIKGKIFQIVLPDEVKPDASTAQRSKTTGHLLITMPKLQQSSESKKGSVVEKTFRTINNAVDPSRLLSKVSNLKEPGKVASKNPDWRNIVPEKKGESYEMDSKSDPTLLGKGDGDKDFSEHSNKGYSKGSPQSEFIDDPDVPPLI